MISFSLDIYLVIVLGFLTALTCVTIGYLIQLMLERCYELADRNQSNGDA